MSSPQGTFLSLARLHAGWGEERVIPNNATLEGIGFTITGDPRWYTIVRTIAFTLETNEEAAERVVSLEVERDGKKVWASHIEPVVAASKKQSYALYAGQSPGVGASVLGATTAIIPEVVLHPGDKLVVAVANMKAGDKIVTPVSMQERFDFAGIPNTRYTDALREFAEHLHKEMMGHG